MDSEALYRRGHMLELQLDRLEMLATQVGAEHHLGQKDI